MKKTNNTWGGRFKEAASELMKSYTDSQHYDRELYAEDILASKAHAEMLGESGILSSEDVSKICSGLDQIQKEIETGNFTWREDLEDVHMNIEARLVELVGESGKKLHTARSRNDQVGIDFRLYINKNILKWRKACVEVCRVISQIASENVHTILPGYTHMQAAQPVSLAQHLLAYAGMFKRDVQRIDDALKRIKISPLGACALAGTTYPIQPELSAKILNFPQIYANSMDAVSDRDFVIEAQFIASVTMMHLSRLCEEIIIWSSPNFAFISLPDDFSTGSSIMPQKKNPDVAELMRGKTGRIYGNLISILTIMKGLPLSYNRDLQEDKEAYFESSRTLLSSLEIMAAMLPKINFNTQAMRKACEKGFLNATELADYLVTKKLPFREAHRITGELVAFAETHEKNLEDLSLDDFQKFASVVDKDVYVVLDYNNCVNRRESPGGPGPQSIQKQLRDLSAWLSSYE